MRINTLASHEENSMSPPKKNEDDSINNDQQSIKRPNLNREGVRNITVTLKNKDIRIGKKKQNSNLRGAIKYY